MSVQLNHTIVWCHDKLRSSAFLAGMLGRPAPEAFYNFMVVKVDNDVSLDFMEKEGEIALQHYAFLIDEEAFDGVFTRVKAAGLTYWSDPARSHPNEINRNDGGRAFYFEDPDGHVLEVITRPYGSG